MTQITWKKLKDFLINEENVKKPFNQMLTNQKILDKLKIDLNLRPQNSV